MKRHPINRALGLLVLALAAAGCATTQPDAVGGPGGSAGAAGSAGSGGTVGPDGRPVAAPVPVPTPEEERKVALVTPDRPEFTVSESDELLRVKLSVVAEDEASAAFADGVRETAVTALRDRKVKIVENGKEDLELAFRVRNKVFNEAPADYVTLDGTVSARLADAPKGDVLAEKSFRGRNEPALGADAASVALSGALAGDVSKWIAETVVPAQIPLESRTLRVARLNNWKPGEAAFANSFVKDVSGMDGVLRCETASLDLVAHAAEFRVLYRRMAFPQGLVPAVIAARPEYGFVLK